MIYKNIRTFRPENHELCASIRRGVDEHFKTERCVNRNLVSCIFDNLQLLQPDLDKKALASAIRRGIILYAEEEI